ncbi:MAG: hypothetical protein JSR31_15080 [Nitrospira sp.]|nr:hypothetical protein [Nitrospira sp.]
MQRKSRQAEVFSGSAESLFPGLEYGRVSKTIQDFVAAMDSASKSLPI